MKNLLIIAIAALASLFSVSCSLDAPSTWSKQYSPLDTAGVAEEETVKELHEKNLRSITGNGIFGF